MSLVPAIKGFVGEAGKIFDERMAADERRLQDCLHRQHLARILDSRIDGLQDWQNHQRQMGKFCKVMHAYAQLQIALAKKDRTPPNDGVSAAGALYPQDDDNASDATSLEHIYE